MNPILDTVEPDAYDVGGWYMRPKQAAKYADESKNPLYSGLKVESLLAECRKEARKEALLEAASECSSKVRHIEFQDGVRYCRERLRRMAEGEKHE